MNKRIAVIGDVMLDVYKSGTSTRLSPECPVPVVDDVKVENRLGGAANVCRTLKVFTEYGHLYATVGDDYQGAQITSLLAEHKLRNDLRRGRDSKTITKTRILANDQQLCRIDAGYIKDAPPALGETPDAIIVSDYGKGTITKSLMTDLITKNNCFIIVDPKGTDWEKYTGVYALTPNIREFEEAYGEFSYLKALGLTEELNLLGGILVTLGANGMHWIGRDGASILRQTERREVRDVSGAGDTVIAAFTLFLPAGIRKAMDYANRAAGDVVTKLGTAIPDKNAVIEVVVFTNGCFDIIHSGHIALLNHAATLGDKLVVGINSDDSMKRIKRTPINDMMERKKVLESIAGVDSVVIFDDDTPYDLIKNLRPEIIVKGGDYTIDTVVGHELVDEVKIIPMVEGKSTTNIIDKVREVPFW